MFLEPVEVFARSDTSRVKPSKVTNTRVSNSRSSRSRVQRSRASNARVRKRTSSRARKETIRKENRVRRQNTRLSLEARWKRLPVKQKIKLYHSMVRTMAVLELSRRQRSTKTSSLYPFWQLFIAQAYAQTQRGTCFLGGHIVPNCNWRATRLDTENKRCSLNNTNDGIRCNRAVFPTAPCVRDFNDPAVRSIRSTYSTTQACAYADAQLIARHLSSSSNGSLNFGAITEAQKNAVVEDQLSNSNRNLWLLADPGDWIEKRDQLIKDTLDDGDEGDAMTKYNEALLSEATGIVDKLESVNEACNDDVHKSFEKKHCDVFQRDLEALRGASEAQTQTQTLTAPPPAREPEALIEADGNADGDTGETEDGGGRGDDGADEAGEVEEEAGERREDGAERNTNGGCVKFHQLPGEHFCQVKTRDNKYLVVRLERGNEENNRLNAVIYQSNSPEGDYCLNPDSDSDYDFTANNRRYRLSRNNSYSTNFSNLNNSLSEQSITCDSQSRSHSARFTYQNRPIEISKELGASNRCLFSLESNPLSLPLPPTLHSDNTGLFFPGIAGDGDANNRVYRTALEEYNKIKNQGDNNNECIESSYVALREADILFNKTCQRGVGQENKVDKESGGGRSTFFSTASGWLKEDRYKEYDRFFIVSSESREIFKPISPRISSCSDGSACRKNLTFTDYWCGIGNAPSADGTGCETPVATEASSEDWTTGLANELNHCSTATPASARGRGSSGRSTEGHTN